MSTRQGGQEASSCDLSTVAYSMLAQACCHQMGRLAREQRGQNPRDPPKTEPKGRLWFGFGETSFSGIKTKRVREERRLNRHDRQTYWGLQKREEGTKYQKQGLYTLRWLCHLLVYENSPFQIFKQENSQSCLSSGEQRGAPGEVCIQLCSRFKRRKTPRELSGWC